MATSLYTGVKGITDSSIKDEDTGTVLVLPTADEATLDPGIEEIVVTARSQLGETVVVDSYIDSQQPVLNLTFPKKTPELLGMRLGKKFTLQDDVPVEIVKTFKVTKRNYPAAEDGFEGFGVPANSEFAIASYLSDDGLSVPLTRGSYAEDIAGTLTWGSGADGAMSFSEDLLGAYVSVRLPLVLTQALALSEENFLNLSMRLVLIQTDLKIVQLEIPSIRPNLGEGEISFTEGTLPLSFRVAYDGSTCVPISIKYLGQARKC